MAKKSYIPIETGLVKDIKYRVMVRGRLKQALGFGAHRPFIIVDTGCKTTLIPLKWAKRFGRATNVEERTVIGSFAGVAQGFLIDRLAIEELEMSNVFMFAADFTGELADRILLGLNVLNNWNYEIRRHENKMLFSEELPTDRPAGIGYYMNYFKRDGSHVFLQDEHELTHRY